MGLNTMVFKDTEKEIFGQMVDASYVGYLRRNKRDNKVWYACYLDKETDNRVIQFFKHKCTMEKKNRKYLFGNIDFNDGKVAWKLGTRKEATEESLNQMARWIYSCATNE